MLEDITTDVGKLLFVSVFWIGYVVLGAFMGMYFILDYLWSFVHAHLTDFLFPAPKKNKDSYEVIEDGQGGTTYDTGELPVTTEEIVEMRKKE